MDPTSFDAVYYPAPYLPEWGTLALASLVFDRLYFPGVYLPPEYDYQEVKRLRLRANELTER